MAYSKKTFTNGQVLTAGDLNQMSDGILEALGKYLPEALDYLDNTAIADSNGTTGAPTPENSRAVMGSFLAVNKGDRIVVNDPTVKFVAYAFGSTSPSSFMGYIDSNPEDTTSSFENWGNDFTFTDVLNIAGSDVEVTYPLYVKLVFRKVDGSSTIFTKDFKDTMEYYITADNSHLFGKRQNTISTARVNSILLNTNLVSHRGLCDVAPENTFASITKAFEADMKIIEIDIQMTADNIPVLLHDSTIDRTSTGSGSIGSLTYAEASQYDYGSWFSEEFTGEKLPTLEEVLIWAKTRGICLELDLANRGFTVEQQKVIYDMVLHLGMLECTIFTASQAELNDYLSFDPNLIISVSGITSLSVAQTVLPNYTSAGLVWASIPLTNLSKELVATIHELKMKAKVWTVNDTTTLEQALSYGVDIILSDGLVKLY